MKTTNAEIQTKRRRQRNMFPDKTPEEQLSEVELGSLLEKGFRIMIVKMIQISEKEWRHRLRRYKKCLTKRRFKEQTEMNNTINQMKNTLEGINSRITETEEWIRDLKDRMVEITAMEQNKERRMIRNENSLREL